VTIRVVSERLVHLSRRLLATRQAGGEKHGFHLPQAACTATVLFTDIVGSTHLMEELAEQADATRREHFRLLRRAIAETGGVEVKTLGDGIMAAFESVGSAVASATAMQQGVSQARRRSGTPLAIRVGISVGDVTTEEHDYFGMPVVDAARLCSAADPGQILVSDLVPRLMRRRACARRVGELTISGREDPVVTWEIVWAQQPTRGVALVGAESRTVDQGGLGDRDEEPSGLDLRVARRRPGTPSREVQASAEPVR
jgi:class 3 adenylate cyclase